MADAPTPDAVSKPLDSVVVYGIRDTKRAISLIYSLAEIPCYPSVIYRIDRYGKLIGALDQLRLPGQPARIYFIRVLKWNLKGLPVIGWTLRPRDINGRLEGKARRILGLYSSKLRGKPPMTVQVSVQEHAALHAKMTRIAS